MPELWDWADVAAVGVILESCHSQKLGQYLLDSEHFHAEHRAIVAGIRYGAKAEKRRRRAKKRAYRESLRGAEGRYPIMVFELHGSEPALGDRVYYHNASGVCLNCTGNAIAGRVMGYVHDLGLVQVAVGAP